MIISDYECCKCGNICEHFINSGDTELKPCPECGGDMARIISVSGQYCSNQDAAWLKSSAEVAGTETPEGREFKRNPTRANLKAWMAVKGLRHMDPGEKPGRPDQPKMETVIEGMIKKYRERHRLEI
jgi:putative FmdB family regulatory protein